MRIHCCKLLLTLACVLPLAGCADGPFTEWARMNPYYRKEWQQDEQYGPTFHQQLAELRDIRENPRSFPPGEREQVVQMLATIVRESDNPVLRTEATLTLGAFPTTSGDPPNALQASVLDQEPDVRIAGCKALGTIGGEQALSALAEVVEKDASLDVRMAATQELARFQGPRVVQSLGVALNDDNPALQHRAVQSLKAATGRDYGDSVPAWREFVQGRTPSVPEAPSIAERILRSTGFN